MRAQKSQTQERSKAEGAGRHVKYSSLEGLLRGFGIERRTPEMAEILRLCGTPETLPEEIPVERFREILHWLAQRMFPELDREVGLFEVGSSLFQGYRRTILGQIQLAALHLMGPERFLRRSPEIFNRITNFGQRSVEQLEPGAYIVRFRGVPLPGSYYCGMMTEALKAAGIASPEVNFEQVGEEDMDFYIRWATRPSPG